MFQVEIFAYIDDKSVLIVFSNFGATELMKWFDIEIFATNFYKFKELCLLYTICDVGSEPLVYCVPSIFAKRLLNWCQLLAISQFPAENFNFIPYWFSQFWWNVNCFIFIVFEDILKELRLFGNDAWNVDFFAIGQDEFYFFFLYFSHLVFYSDFPNIFVSII